MGCPNTSVKDWGTSIFSISISLSPASGSLSLHYYGLLTDFTRLTPHAGLAQMVAQATRSLVRAHCHQPSFNLQLVLRAADLQAMSAMFNQVHDLLSRAPTMQCPSISYAIASHDRPASLMTITSTVDKFTQATNVTLPALKMASHAAPARNLRERSALPTSPRPNLRPAGQY
ncbi:hypothetical protein GY45DRAFT_357542 [Cubamyces sp. BRFM 1775]|nr:hypothetical protein GY45DRAFT_357542 [Cubamyces sp. BRFM 1775]